MTPVIVALVKEGLRRPTEGRHRGPAVSPRRRADAAQRRYPAWSQTELPPPAPAPVARRPARRCRPWSRARADPCASTRPARAGCAGAWRSSPACSASSSASSLYTVPELIAGKSIGRGRATPPRSSAAAATTTSPRRPPPRRRRRRPRRRRRRDHPDGAHRDDPVADRDTAAGRRAEHRGARDAVDRRAAGVRTRRPPAPAPQDAPAPSPRPRPSARRARPRRACRAGRRPCRRGARCARSSAGGSAARAWRRSARARSSCELLELERAGVVGTRGHLEAVVPRFGLGYERDVVVLVEPGPSSLRPPSPQVAARAVHELDGGVLGQREVLGELVVAAPVQRAERERLALARRQRGHRAQRGVQVLVAGHDVAAVRAAGGDRVVGQLGAAAVGRRGRAPRGRRCARSGRAMAAGRRRGRCPSAPAGCGRARRGRRPRPARRRRSGWRSGAAPARGGGRSRRAPRRRRRRAAGRGPRRSCRPGGRGRRRRGGRAGPGSWPRR